LLEEEDAAQRHSRTARALAALTPAEAEAALRFVVANFRPEEANRRARRLALIGLRGAGKSTIGRLLATHFNRPFLELDALIAEEAGMDLAGIFELHGQAAFRRFERAALEKILAGAQDFVLATGGGIVADPGTFERLLGGCLTIWLRASPEEHMRRVIAQGDPRPMAQNPRAMDDLRAILLSREPLYARADITLDTTGIDPLAGMAALLPLIG
jgi:XRE family aerobic/anaerobic benzoate catabolism transcriptional regulator